MTEAVRARVDAAGLLIMADEPLLALNARAGGALGTPLALPRLAALVRLTSTMQVPLSRGIVVADNGHDLDLMVQTSVVDQQSPYGIDLVITRWTRRAPRLSWLIGHPRAADSNPSTLPWQWCTDASLILTEVVIAPRDDIGLAAVNLGQPLTRLVRLIEDDDGDLPILTALAEGVSFSRQRAVRRDQPDVEIELSAEAVRNAAGIFLGFEGKAASPFCIEQAEFEVDNDLLEEKIGNALRMPIDRIVSRAETIAAQTDGPLRREYADYAGDIASAGSHLLALVDDLADLQAVERPDFSVERETIDLTDLARRAAGLLSVRAAIEGVRIDRPATDEISEAQGDFRRTLQILVNLVGNAVRYSPKGAMIWLRTEQDAYSAIVVVADQGKGIALADQARIFDKFERVDQSEPGGSGLGLYISRRLARAMGGDITVDSAPGQGARFVLTLPVAR